jgi:1,4-dihydroxy-2-naphthoate octaprenyltransferase
MQRLASGATGMALIPVLGDTGRLQLVFGGLLALGLAVTG